MTHDLSHTRMMDRSPRSILEIIGATAEEIDELPALIRQETDPRRKMHLVARLKCRQAVLPSLHKLLKQKEKEAKRV